MFSKFAKKIFNVQVGCGMASQVITHAEIVIIIQQPKPHVKVPTNI
jgi:hypothetical protein